MIVNGFATPYEAERLFEIDRTSASRGLVFKGATPQK
jgi:hypothetical protein